MTKFIKISNLVTVIILLFPISPLRAQVEDLVMTVYSGEERITALKSVTLKNGFHIPAGGQVLVAVQATPNMITAQDRSQNYILRKTFKLAGINQTNLATVRTTAQENRTIDYLDGFGRVNQSIAVMGSPSFKDVVKTYEYDGMGRRPVDHLPYAEKTGTKGNFKSTAKSDQLSYYKSTGWDPSVVKSDYPYSVIRFDGSPLGRVVESGAPGNDWQPANAGIVGSGHTKKIKYSVNVDKEVRYWSITASGAISTSYYTAGTLSKTTLLDENIQSGKAGSVEDYKDLEGRVVLKRVWESETKSLNTYYVYDEFGDLRYVIPSAVTAASFTESDANFTNYIYAYKYDERRRLTNKKIPGKGWEYLVYNKNDQMVLSQDSLQRARKEWIYTRYDACGRITSTGLYTNTAKTTLSDVQALVNVATGPLWETRTGADYPSPATTFPLAGTGITIKPHIINYYDDYSFTGSISLATATITRSAMTESLQTGAKVYGTDGTLPLLTVLYYDDYGRVIQIASANHLEGKDYVTNTYSFVGELENSTRVHTPKTGTATTIVTKNDYDHVGRLIATKEKIGSQAEVILAFNSYNEIGQLKATSVGKAGTETAFINTTTFSYNERGWLTKRSSPKFSQQLKYQDGNNPQWNGNISQQLWGNDLVLRDTFSYQYDKLNRLLSGVSKPAGAAGMSELLTYDELGMGNIKTLKRDVLDVTTYTYSGNKLTGLTGGLEGAYTYDGNGNASKDRTGMIFSYNYLNLPQSANKTGTSVSYLYDATGTKLQKKSTIGTVNSSRDYIDGIEYKGADIDIIHNSTGYALKSGTNYVYHYNLTDHLGNVRATLKRGSTATAVDVTQRDNYYPFGKQKVVAGGNNKYLYNGKEIQAELGGQYDYGARYYDAEVGRFIAIDVMAEGYASYSPYAYVGNNPILFNDPTGMYKVDANSNLTINSPEEISSFLYYLQNNKDATISDFAHHIISADRGFAWDLEEITISGRNSFDNGTWLGRAENRVIDAVNKMGNIKSVTTANFGFENSKEALDIGGGVYGAFEKATVPGNNYWLGKNGKYYNFTGRGANKFTGSRLGALKAARIYKFAGNAALATSVIIGGVETYRGYQMDGGQIGYNTQKAAASTAGAVVGGWAGAKVGAATGAAIGVWFYGVGSVPGFVIGGVIGGLGGGYYGGKIGGNAGESIVDYYHGR